MPLVSTINVSKKIVMNEASIYKDSPEREFFEVTDDQKEKLELIYNDMKIDSKMLLSNRYFKLQKQNHILVEPVNGKLTIRVLKNHHVDVIPDPRNPEVGEVYILSSFDKSQSGLRTQEGNGVNEKIGDVDDYRLKNFYSVWSNDAHFVMNGRGEIVSEGEDFENPIGMIPIVEVAGDKDFEYFLSYGSSLTDFTIEFNAALSSLAHVVDLQGFAVGWMKGPKGLMPTQIDIGPSKILALETDPQLGTETDFGFASPGADIAGSQNFVESLLAMYLSSRGVNTSAITSQQGSSDKFTSGLDRLLAMIEKFEASKEDISIYEGAEQKIFEIVKAWHNALLSTDQLDQVYKSSQFSDNASMSIQYATPEMVQTEEQKLDIAERRWALGLDNKEEMLMRVDGLTEEQAKEKLEAINDRQENKGIENNEERSQSDDQP
jgi:hypothetical protein